MKPILFIIALAACSKTNDVTLLLGPDEERVSRGFVCRAEAAPNELLMAKALVPGTRRLRFALVVDVFELDAGGVFPGCRGEELLTFCRERDCEKSVTRHCEPNIEVEFPEDFDADDRGDVTLLLDRLRDALGNKTLLRDLPSSPVIVRVVAVEACPATSDIDLGPIALGCAYSCPVQLDQVSGSIAISIDTFEGRCESAVRACASFP